MEPSQERLIFALNVLDGEPNAHRILADMLEEDGDRGLADWARARKGKRHKRIDFVLALLPHRISLRIACDYLVQSLRLIEEHQWQSHHRFDSHRTSLAGVILAVDGISQWSQGRIDSETLSQHRTEIGAVGPWTHGVQDIDLTMRALHAAVNYAGTAELQKESDPRSAQHQSRESRHASRKVAKASRELVRPLIADLQWRALKAKQRGSTAVPAEVGDQVAWQIEHAKQVIHEKLDESKLIR